MPTLPLRLRRTPTWVSMALVCGFLAAHALPAVAAEIEFKTIVLFGDPASGLAAGTTFTYPTVAGAGGAAWRLCNSAHWLVDESLSLLPKDCKPAIEHIGGFVFEISCEAR